MSLNVSLNSPLNGTLYGPGVSGSTGLARESEVSKWAAALLHCCRPLLPALVLNLGPGQVLKSGEQKEQVGPGQVLKGQLRSKKSKWRILTPVSRLTSAMLASLVLSEWAACHSFYITYLFCPIAMHCWFCAQEPKESAPGWASSNLCETLTMMCSRPASAINMCSLFR